MQKEKMDKSDGGIKLYRMILESKVFSNEKMLKIWIWCLCKAAHKDHFFPLKTGKGTITIDLLKGQFVFGRFVAAKELKIPGSTLWRILKKFASEEYKNMIALKVNNQYTIVTICKWAEYQDEFFKGGHPTDNQWTTNGQPTDTYNNVNKVNNVNNGKKLPNFFNKNFSSEVNALIDDFIKQEKEDLKHEFNHKRLKNEIEKLKNIPPAEQPEVLKKAIASCSRTLEPLTKREKASIGNEQWDWETEYLNP